MGNGQGIVSPALTEEDLEKAIDTVIASFGKPSMIFLPAAAMGSFMSIGNFEINPQYSGTPWAETARMTKRERAVAGLHTTLKKLGALKKISEEEFNGIRNKTIKRLKKAKWARYQQKKKKA